MAKTPKKKTTKPAVGSRKRKKPAVQKSRKAHKSKGRPPSTPAKPKRPRHIPPPPKPPGGFKPGKAPLIHDDRDTAGQPPAAPPPPSPDDEEMGQDGSDFGAGSLPKSFKRLPETVDHLDDVEQGSMLSVREKRFVDAYLGVARCVASRAAKMAGCVGDARTLAVTGHRMLMRDNVQQVIADSRLALKGARDDLIKLCLRNMGSNMSELLEPMVDAAGNVTVVISLRKAASRGALRWVKELTEDLDSGGVLKRKIKIIDGKPWAELLARIMGYSSDRLLLAMQNKAKGDGTGGKPLGEMNEEELAAELMELEVQPGDQIKPRADGAGSLPGSSAGGVPLPPGDAEKPATGGQAHDPGQ